MSKENSELLGVEKHMIPQWLDAESRELVVDLVQTFADGYPEFLIAVLLFGSIARHDERPLDDPEPSDVDLLAIFATDEHADLINSGIFTSLGFAYRRHIEAPREVNFMFATRTMHEWDPLFIENVARDGIVLYARGPLPDAISSKRAASFS